MSDQQEWLYYRVYVASIAEIRDLVEQVVGPAVRRFTAEDPALRWFFLQYVDLIGLQLRLRLRGAPGRLAGYERELDQDFRRALDDLAAADGPRGPLAAHRMVTKRLYEPEHGKFGGPAGVALAERLMQCGSEAALMRLGVRGFITKDTSAAKLADVVRQVHAGGRFIDPEIATDALALGGSPLSTREREVLTLSGEGLRLAEIAGRLCLAEGTVRNYMSSIMNKLDVDNRVAAHRAAREAGWL